MRRIITFILFCCLALALCACENRLVPEQTEAVSVPQTTVGSVTDPPTPTEPESKSVIETKKYTLYRKNETYYMLSHIQNSPTTDNGSSAMFMLDFPRFSSIGEMKRKLETGDLTDSQIFALTYRTNQEGTQICNLDDLYEAVLPPDLTVDYIELHSKGDGYWYFFKELQGNFICEQDGMWEYFYDDFQNPKHHRQILREETVADRSATVVCIGRCSLQACSLYHRDSQRSIICQRDIPHGYPGRWNPKGNNIRIILFGKCIR